MDTVRLAYRDNDRTPTIFVIKEMARSYDLDVDVVRIQPTDEYEAALFDGSADMICEHLEYLYQEAAEHGRKSVMFLAPVTQTDNELVVGRETRSVEDLRGKRIAVRTHGRPYEIALQLRALGLEGSVELISVADADVGRWRQFTKILDGDCAATFMPCLNLPPALAAGLRALPVEPLPIVGHWHHACAAEYAREHHDVMRRYTMAVIHAACLMKLRRTQALEIVAREPARLMGLENDRPELERSFDCMAAQLQLRPIPTPTAIANSYEIATAEWPGGTGMNPMALWDTHWAKQLDDEGFVENLIAKLKG